MTGGKQKKAELLARCKVIKKELIALGWRVELEMVVDHNNHVDRHSCIIGDNDARAMLKSASYLAAWMDGFLQAVKAKRPRK